MTISRESWKLDDKEWMKNRRTEWKYYEYNLKKIVSFEKMYFPAYKDYYLTGNNESLKKFVGDNFSGPRLAEMWLHAADDVDIFKEVAKKITDVSLVRSKFLGHTPSRENDFKGLSHFNGKDLNIYSALFPCHFLKEDYPDMGREEFVERAWYDQIQEIHVYMDFFEREEYMPFDYCQLTVPYWKEMLIVGYKNDPVNERVLNYFDELNTKGVNHPKKEKLLQEIMAVFDSNDLPKDAQKEIKSIRDGRLS